MSPATKGPYASTGQVLFGGLFLACESNTRYAAMIMEETPTPADHSADENGGQYHVSKFI